MKHFKTPDNRVVRRITKHSNGTALVQDIVTHERFTIPHVQLTNINPTPKTWKVHALPRTIKLETIIAAPAA